MMCLVAKASRAGPRGMACFVQKKISRNNVYQTPSRQSSCASASFWLASGHVFFFFSLSLQAVETNLASKDSHWVFVNEVRAPEWRGAWPALSPHPLGKCRVILSGSTLTWGAGIDSRAPLCKKTGERGRQSLPSYSPGAGGNQGKSGDLSPGGSQESMRSGVRH